jgi:hypothetical protein
MRSRAGKPQILDYIDFFLFRWDGKFAGIYCSQCLEFEFFFGIFLVDLHIMNRGFSNFLIVIDLIDLGFHIQMLTVFVVGFYNITRAFGVLKSPLKYSD